MADVDADPPDNEKSQIREFPLDRGYTNWFIGKDTSLNARPLWTDRHKKPSLAQWQQTHNDMKCALQVTKGSSRIIFKATEANVNYRVQVQGDSEFPRIILRQICQYTDSKKQKQTFTQQASFPVWGSDGHNYDKNNKIVVPGQSLPRLIQDRQYFFSTAMSQARFELRQLQPQEKKGSGYNDDKQHWLFEFRTEETPACYNFRAPLDMFNLSATQQQAVRDFRLLLQPAYKVHIITQAPAQLVHVFDLLANIPNPTPPPFPLYDCRYHTGDKQLLPIQTKRIPPFESPAASDVIVHHCRRQADWPDYPPSYTEPRQIVTRPTDSAVHRFETLRQYEVTRQVGLIREVQYQARHSKGPFNRRYDFDLVPVGLSKASPESGSNEFYVFMNVRPSQENASLHPPEAGTTVTIKIEDGSLQNASARAEAAEKSSGMPYAADQSGKLLKAKPNTPMATPRGSRAGSVAGSPRGPDQRPRSGTATSQGSHTSSIPRSPTALQGLTRSASGTQIGSPTLQLARMSIDSRLAEAQISSSGPREPREWRGVVVPRSGNQQDPFDICIHVRVDDTGFGRGLQGCNGHFAFGVPNPPYKQIEQAVRMLIHGDNFYQIPVPNWLQEIVLAHDNNSIAARFPPGTPHPNVARQSGRLNREQREALINSLSSGNNLRSMFSVIVGPPGTGKTMTAAEIAYHSYKKGETLIMVCGSNYGLDNLAEAVWNELKGEPKPPGLASDQVWMAFRLQTENNEHFANFERNMAPWGTEFKGSFEFKFDDRLGEYSRPFNQISEDEYKAIESWVDKRIHTDRRLSLGAFLKFRLEKAKTEGSQWVNDWPPWDSNRVRNSQEEYACIWAFLTMRIAAKKLGVTFADFVHATAEERAEATEDLHKLSRRIINESTATWRDLQAFYLRRARIILVTSSTAGRQTMNRVRAQRVLVDEACQMTEGETLNACVRSFSTLKKLILIGDPAQLPPTVTSERENEQADHHKKSLMLRLLETGVPAHNLLIQARMVPEISYFISEEHYYGRLQDHPSVANPNNRPEAERFRDWVVKSSKEGGHTVRRSALLFVSVAGSRVFHRINGTSFFNPAYMDVLLTTFMSAWRNLKGVQSGRKITWAILVFYSEELLLYKKAVYQVQGISEDDVAILTVDAAQGREFDYVFVSTCRPGSQVGLGFVADRNRQNVALSRARNGLVVVGHQRMGRIQNGTTVWHCWENLVTYCRTDRGRGSYFETTGNANNIRDRLDLNLGDWVELVG